MKVHESPYSTFANNPIWFNDPNGADTSFKNNASRTDFNNMLNNLDSEIAGANKSVETAKNRLAAASCSQEESAKDNLANAQNNLKEWTTLKSNIYEAINSPTMIHVDGDIAANFRSGIFGEFYWKEGQGFTVEYTYGRLSTLAHEFYHAYQLISYQTSTNPIAGEPGFAYDQMDEVNARFVSILFDPTELDIIKSYSALINDSDMGYVKHWVNLQYVVRGIGNRTTQITLTDKNIIDFNKANYEAGLNGRGPVQYFQGWEKSYKEGLNNTKVNGAKKYWSNRIFGE